MRFRKPVALTTFLLLGLMGAAQAEVLKVERPIRLPDGKPAAGAKVLLRSLNLKDGTLKEEKRVVADDQGIARAEINIDENDDGGMDRVTGYMMVDMPGFALVFESFSNWRRRRPRDVEPLSLGVGYELKGKVLTRKKEPVAGAEVSLAAFVSNWFNTRINYPSADIATPEVTTQSQADGSFELRPVRIQQQTFGNGEPVVRPLLIARATQGDVVLTGRSEYFARKVGAPPPTGNLQDNSIYMYPAATVRGQVLGAIDGQAVAGARIVLRADPGDATTASIRPATTGHDGKFEFLGVPASFQLFAEATHPNFANGWTRIGNERNQIAGDEPYLYDNVEIRMRPWTETRGRIVDVLTKAPPLTPMSILSVYDEGYNDGRIGVGHYVAQGRVNGDGTFSMKMPVGFNHVRVRGPGYWEGGHEHPINLDVKPAGALDLLLEVRRENGFLVHFESNAPKGQAKYDYDVEYDLHMRGKDGNESTTNWGEWWYWPLYNPDDILEIRVTRGVDGVVQEVVPWTKLTPQNKAPGDPQHWPRRIWLPLRQTVSVRGRVVDSKNGKPVPGATVKLVALPEEAVEKTAPVTTGADGSFVFEHIPLPSELSVTATLPEAGGLPEREGTTRVGPTPLAAVRSDTDEGHQEFKDVVVKLPAS